jgi:Holliday junction resolvase RusA-like endonuclease
VKQEFFIPIRFPSTNEVIKWCKTPGKGAKIYAGRKNKYQEDILTVLTANKVQPVTGKIVVHFHWVEPNRRRDFDNIVSFGQKWTLDALKKGGIIVDDSREYIARTTHDIAEEVCKDLPGVYVTLEEV